MLTKVPCTLAGIACDNGDASNWHTYDTVRGMVGDGTGNDGRVMTGIGLAMAANPYPPSASGQPASPVAASVGQDRFASAVAGWNGPVLVIDIDKCRDPVSGVVDDWAIWIVEACHTYTEVSPSGSGLRLIGAPGLWDMGEKQRRWTIGLNADGKNIGVGEVFYGSGFATVTFQALAGYARLFSDIGMVAAGLEKRKDDKGLLGVIAGGGASVSGADPLAPIDVITETLGYIPNGSNDGIQSWDWWSHVGMCVFRACGGSDSGLAAWEAWSVQHPVYGGMETCDFRWDHWIKSSPPTAVGFGSLLFLARDAQARMGNFGPDGIGWKGGPVWTAYDRGKRAGGLGALPGVAGLGGPNPNVGVPGGNAGVAGGSAVQMTVAGGLGPVIGGIPPTVPVGNAVGGGAGVAGSVPIIAEEGLARRYVDDWGADLRYIAKWGKWVRWEEIGRGGMGGGLGGVDAAGGVWKDDIKLDALRLARETCVAGAVAVGIATKGGIAMMSAKTVRACEFMARADSRVAATADQWDTDIWLLNTPGGVLDLRAGGLRAAERGMHMTKITLVTPDFTGVCPVWRRFLGQITCGNAELEAYLARVAGYCLTGDVSEHALFFLYGDGSNGKGTFLNVLTTILGVDEYARNAGAETFTAGRSEQHLTEIARLRGARLVVTTEVEEGKAWAEARVKMLTGGDPITARFMGQDHFTYMPQFKLVFAGNHKPRIRAVNEANRRRINLIPFMASFTGDQKDKDLFGKLMAEAGAILAWAVNGCREYLRVGLAAPLIVTRATEEYMASEDTRHAWMSECCVDRRGDQRFSEGIGGVRPADLFVSWRNWAEKAQEYVGNQRAFVDWLKQQGYEFGPDKLDRTIVRGIHLLVMGAIEPNNPKLAEKGFGIIEGGKGNAPEKA